MGWRRAISIGAFIADSDGADFRATTSLVGWEDAAPIRSDAEDKMQQDGGWDAAGYFGARIINHGGQVAQTSRANALAVVDDLQSLLPGTTHDFTVDDPNVGVRSSTVRVVQGASVEWASPVRFTYTLQLRAADPLKYGPATFDSTGLSSAAGGDGLTFPLAFPLDFGATPGVTPGALTIANAGTSSYLPRLRVDGPVTNPVVSLAETGDRIAYMGTVAAGQWLDIDCARRRVLLNGLVSMRHLVSFTGAWCAIPVGGGSLSWTADTADPDASLSCWAYEGAWS